MLLCSMMMFLPSAFRFSLAGRTPAELSPILTATCNSSALRIVQTSQRHVFHTWKRFLDEKRETQRLWAQRFTAMRGWPSLIAEMCTCVPMLFCTPSHWRNRSIRHGWDGYLPLRFPTVGPDMAFFSWLSRAPNRCPCTDRAIREPPTCGV